MEKCTAPSKSLEEIIKDCLINNEIVETSIYPRGIAEGYTHKQIKQYYDQWIKRLETKRTDDVRRKVCT